MLEEQVQLFRITTITFDAYLTDGIVLIEVPN